MDADIADLYLAADLMVTDYSSTMFDFTVTGKPLLFYTYDLERYRDELRGSYFDLAADAPGPLVTSTAESLAQIRDVQRMVRSTPTATRGFRRSSATSTTAMPPNGS